MGDKDVLRVVAAHRRRRPDRCVAAQRHCIQVQNFDGPFGLSGRSRSCNFFTVAGITSVTIDAGLGVDIVEFTGDYLVPNSSLTVNAEKIRVKPVSVTIGVGTGTTSRSTRSTKDNGLSLVGITTTIPVIGVSGLIDVDCCPGDGELDHLQGLRGDAHHGRANDDEPERAERHARRRLGRRLRERRDVHDRRQPTPAPTPAATSTPQPVNSSSPASRAAAGTSPRGTEVRKDIVENGSDTGLRHAALELEYHANVNVHGASLIVAAGDVTLASTIDVTATAHAAAGPDEGNWVSGTSYTKGDVVTDPLDSKKYAATEDIASSTDEPNTNDGLLGGLDARPSRRTRRSSRSP